MGLEVYGEQLALNAILNGMYVGLHTAAPSAGNEVAGNGYARQAVGSFTVTPGNPSIGKNDNVIQFPTATGAWGDITHVAIWSAAVGGSIVATQALVAAKTVGLDDAFRFLANKLQVQVD